MKIFIIIIIFIHGLIHLMGFLKAFRFAEISQIHKSISRTAGIIWLGVTLLFMLAGLMLITGNTRWWLPGLLAVLVSQVLIFQAWKDARFGSIANLLILAAVLVGFGTWSSHRMMVREFRSFSRDVQVQGTMVTPQMLDSLPPVVQRWLKHANIVGREKAEWVFIRQTGTMRTSPEGKWVPFRAMQWFHTNDPGFLWLPDVKYARGIHVTGMDRFENGKGQMLLKALSLFPVLNAKGTEINQGSMVRYLAETIWFPSVALNSYIRWKQTDSLQATATMTYKGTAVTGTFTFNTSGDVVSFEAPRYFFRKGGSTLENWFVQMDPDGYREFEGIRIPGRSSIIWKLKTGDYEWLRLEVTDERFNRRRN